MRPFSRSLNLSEYEKDAISGGYLVHLYGPNWIRYADKRQAQRKLTQFSQELTECLKIVNEIYRQTIFASQQVIFSMDDEQLKRYNFLKVIIDEKIHNLIHAKPSQPNNYYFKTVMNLIDDIGEVIDHVVLSCKKKIKYSPIETNIETIQFNLQHILFAVKNIGGSSKTDRIL